MKQWWWKVLGVLLLYTCIVGLRTPLSPSIVHCSIERIPPGPITFEATGYNTHFKDEVWAWIENGGIKTCLNVEVISPDQLRLSGSVPAGLPAGLSDLWVASGIDGDLTLHDAFYTEGTGTGATSDPCTGIDVSPVHHRQFPNRAILNETIRNLFFHVPMWFTMMLLMALSLFHSIRFLRGMDLDADRAALTAVNVSLVFAALGLVTGSLWARATWGAWWTNDVKLNGAAVSTLIYLAYLVLRGSVPDAHKRARLAAVYNIFAFVLMLLFIMVAPRLADSLHPGNGGNPAFSQYDLDARLRAVFYPAVLGWMLLGLWMWTLTFRLSRINADRS